MPLRGSKCLTPVEENDDTLFFTIFDDENEDLSPLPRTIISGI